MFSTYLFNLNVLRAYFVLGPVQNTSDMMASRKNTVLSLSFMKISCVDKWWVMKTLEAQREKEEYLHKKNE